MYLATPNGLVDIYFGVVCAFANRVMSQNSDGLFHLISQAQLKMSSKFSTCQISFLKNKYILQLTYVSAIHMVNIPGPSGVHLCISLCQLSPSYIVLNVLSKIARPMIGKSLFFYLRVLLTFSLPKFFTNKYLYQLHTPIVGGGCSSVLWVPASPRCSGALLTPMLWKLKSLRIYMSESWVASIFLQIDSQSSPMQPQPLYPRFHQHIRQRSRSANITGGKPPGNYSSCTFLPLGVPLEIIGRVSVHDSHAVYTFRPLLTEVPDEKVTLLTRVLCGILLVVKYGATPYCMT